MSYYDTNAITRDGFACGYGRFRVQPGNVERVDGSSLRSMFLPKLTAEGRRKLSASYSDNFVRGQLKHYGVQFDESEISGNGTLLMKKVLQAGKCDKVPDHISKLREQMHTEWLNKLTPEQLSSYPEWVMERYFLSSGQLDHTKTTTVVGIPLPRHSSYRASQMHEVASKVMGLHQATGLGPKTQTIFMGWDSVAVGNAAKSHAAKETKELQAAENERDDERAEVHTDYLNTLKRKKGPRTYSPVGSYIIDCKQIEGEWPEQADDLSLDIRRTKEANVFEASFDFGVLEGVMIISAEKNALEQYCSQLDLEAESDGDEDEGGDGSEEEVEDREKVEVEDKVEKDRKPTTGSKRRAEALQGHGPPPKKPKAKAAQPRIYLLKLKCRETGEGMIQSTQERGTIKFEDENLATFIGKANLPCVGKGVPFTGRKISDTPASPGNSWADYSETAYEHPGQYLPTTPSDKTTVTLDSSPTIETVDDGGDTINVVDQFSIPRSSMPPVPNNIYASPYHSGPVDLQPPLSTITPSSYASLSKGPAAPPPAFNFDGVPNLPYFRGQWVYVENLQRLDPNLSWEAFNGTGTKWLTHNDPDDLYSDGKLGPLGIILLGQLGQFPTLTSAKNSFDPTKPEFSIHLQLDEQSLEVLRLLIRRRDPSLTVTNPLRIKVAESDINSPSFTPGLIAKSAQLNEPLPPLSENHENIITHSLPIDLTTLKLLLQPALPHLPPFPHFPSLQPRRRASNLTSGGFLSSWQRSQSTSL